MRIIDDSGGKTPRLCLITLSTAYCRRFALFAAFPMFSDVSIQLRYFIFLLTLCQPPET